MVVCINYQVMVCGGVGAGGGAKWAVAPDIHRIYAGGHPVEKSVLKDICGCGVEGGGNPIKKINKSWP